MAKFWQSRFIVPTDAVSLFLEAPELEVFCIGAFEIDGREIGDGQSWRVEMLHQEKPSLDELFALLEPVAVRAKLKLAQVEVEQLPDANWVEHVQAEIKPFEIGRFWIHGSHVDQMPPEGLVPIQLDAGLAFGSGEHPTTRGCLAALDDLAKNRRFAEVLDMGCGAGLLAIAAAKCWSCRALAVDNDAVAVDVAEQNAGINGVGEQFDALVSEGYADPKIRERGPYDIILSNILADPLCDMAADLASHLAEDGVAILSGLLDRQASDVAAAHQAHGLFLQSKIELEPWTTLMMSRKKT